MAELSRSRVTITLGRSGQVVKRAGPGGVDGDDDDDGGSFAADSQPSVAGKKRSVLDRLGSNADSTSSQFNNKRQREDVSRLSLSASNDVDDVSLTKDDLRFKIMRKSTLKMDLRELLSRPAQSSTTSLGTQQQRTPQLKDSRNHFLDPRDGRQQMQETRSARQLVPEPRDGRQRLSELRDGRQRLPDSRDRRYIMPELKDVRDRRMASSSSRLRGQIPPSRSTDALPHLDSLRNSYSPWTLDSLRQGSSDRVPSTSRLSPPRRNEEQGRRPPVRAYDDSRLSSYMSKDAFEYSRPISSRVLSPLRRNEELERRPVIRAYDDSRLNSYMSKDALDRSRPISSRGLSPPRRNEELERRPLVRAYDDSRLSSYMSKDAFEHSRAISSAPYPAKTSLTAGPAKSVAPPLLAPPPSSVALVQRNSYTVEDHPTVDSFLHSLGLDKYAINFKAEEVDMYSLKQMGDNDLKELGIPMGPRKKIRLALLSRAKRQL
ncbi:hypothetical protein ACH5RR_035702 [Cinchona calisaya]|uniref:SAM domain-containing protein n=1 Tax=Cinchona calisaya TaxID=153742 RepID=A0ABD2Y188_9GENT